MIDMHRKNKGFTLLEVVIVLFILGLLSVMAWSGLGLIDNAERGKQTIIMMEEIREAIVGPIDRYDENGVRIIGGYVGDMKRFPDLWEARAEIRPDFSGTLWPLPAAGLGQGPSYSLDPSRVFFRPSGDFTGGVWQWLRPFRRLSDDAAGSDHIGGLETENEGQPRGLWTYYVEDLPWDLPGHPAPGLTEGASWKGPYLAPPKDPGKGAEHYAKTLLEYAALDPVWSSLISNEAWADGNYSPSGLGEHFDDKENFRLLNNDGRLSDAWGRAFRFFITADPDRPGETVFWIISEGPDFEGFYPTKGTCSSHAWTVDTTDTMALNYDPDAAQNRDNIVMKIYSHEFETAFEKQESNRRAQAAEQMAAIRKSLIGRAPFEPNTGFVGDVTTLPRLFRWETDRWDDQDGTSDYTKGQPRGLWTRTPNEMDSGDDIALTAWGVGWQTRYHKPPMESGEDEILTDPWGNELLFFSDSANQAMLVLSRGPDGLFDFASTDTDKMEPVNFTEAVDVTAYDPGLSENLDNFHLIIREYEYWPGHAAIGRITILNAVSGTTKARLFRGEGTAASQTLVAGTLTDEDSDGSADDWTSGTWPGSPCWQYDTITTDKILSGCRLLVFWNDTDADNQIDTGEACKAVPINILPVSGSSRHPEIQVDTTHFLPAP